MLSALFGSCAFDPPEPHQKALGAGYFLSYSKTSPNDGIQILYSKDQQFFHVVASNCVEVYRGDTMIGYSEGSFAGDGANNRYFIMRLDSTTSPRQINRNLFKKSIVGFSRVRLDDLRKNSP